MLIYTGGTIGMMQEAESGTLSPVDFAELGQYIPELNQIEAEIDTVAFEKPLDSSNMDLSHWQNLAAIIEQNYHQYDGFVVLHGSDTMAFTAAALSFMLNGLSKAVVITGSQLPIGRVRTDGKENVITAIEIAAAYRGERAMVPEVCIYFEYQLYRGNRTFKYNAEQFQAFRSPNYPVLAEAGVHIKYNENAIRQIRSESFFVDDRMDNRIAVLTLFPGISRHIVEAALSVKDNKLVIVRTFGSGNAMSHSWFLDALQQAHDNGLILINLSQCRAGAVQQGRYATSRGLDKAGLISAGDMVLEAAIAKSMHLLGVGHSGENFKKLFQANLRGEITEWRQ